MKSENRLTEKLGWRVLRGVLVLGWLGVWSPGVQVATAQWISNGPYGGFIQSIAIDPQTPRTVYAGTHASGLFKSSNGGASWTAVNSGLTDRYVYSLVIDPRTPTTLYAGTFNGGVFKSTDGGGSWVSTSPMNSSVHALAIDPQTPSTLYAGTDGGGVFKSENRGENWTAINTGLTNLRVLALAIDPKASATLYAGTFNGGVFKSSNGGGSWAAINTNLSYLEVYALAIDPQTPTILYAGTANGGVFKSADGGGSWVTTSLTNSWVQALAIDPQTPTTVYAGINGGGVSKSSDGGGSWMEMNTELTSPFVFALALDPKTPGILYAGTPDGGIFKSADGAGSWAAVNKGLTISSVQALAIDPKTPDTLYAGIDSFGGVFKSTDGGGGWTTINSGLTDRYVHALAVDPQTPTTLYAGTSVGFSLFKSTNGGGSWTYSGAGLTSSDVYALAIDPQTPTTLYAGINGGVFKSMDGGGSWVNTALTNLTNSRVQALALDPQTPTTIYAGTDGRGVFKSMDGGGNWTAISTGLTNSYMLVLAIDPQTPSTLYAGTGGGGVYRSENGGGTWKAISVGLTSSVVQALAIDPRMPTSVFAGTSDGGVFKSVDGGETWTAFNPGLTSSDVWALAIDTKNPSRIYAGTSDGGVFVYTETACSYSISPATRTYSIGGTASDQVNVTTPNGCLWMATSNEPWIVISSGSSGSGNGVVTYSVFPNPGPGSRTGTITIADQVLTLIQAGINPSLFISSISPNSGPVAGGTALTIAGGGFQAGASVSIGDFQATVSNVTNSQIKATTGIALKLGTYDVVVTNPGGEFAVLENGFTYVAGTVPDVNVLVPIVLSAAGLNGSFFTSEMTLTNRGVGNTTVEYTYTSSIGSGSGTARDNLAPGRQEVVPDAIDYLRSLGIPIPSSGNQGGTLLVTFSGLSSRSDGGVTVRTTTVVPEGRAGLAYSGIPTTMALNGPSYICGLRQNQTDRSNLAIQNLGSFSDGTVTLRLTVFSGNGSNSSGHVLPDQVLPPGGWAQISGILTSNGFSLSNGYVRVERLSGTAPYYAYGVINDQANSDGSFVPPILENSLTGRTGLTLPVIVETSAFSSELVLCNWSTTPKTLHFFYAGDALQSESSTTHFDLVIAAGEQRIIPNLVEWLRGRSGSGIGPVGPSYAGPLFATVDQGDINGIFMGARTSTLGGRGEYGLFYTATPYGSASVEEAWLYSLRQDDENRANLAIVNTGESDGNPDTFEIELFDGNTGTKVNTVRGVTINASRWFQMGSILDQYAPSTTQGYAHIIRTSGSNPFIAYAVINDGARPQERSGDGAFIASSP